MVDITRHNTSNEPKRRARGISSIPAPIVERFKTFRTLTRRAKGISSIPASIVAYFFAREVARCGCLRAPQPDADATWRLRTYRGATGGAPSFTDWRVHCQCIRGSCRSTTSDKNKRTAPPTPSSPGLCKSHALAKNCAPACIVYRIEFRRRSCCFTPPKFASWRLSPPCTRSWESVELGRLRTA